MRTFSDIELASGKVKAFFDRVKVRDLYDISTLGRFFATRTTDGALDADVWHQVVLYYASLSATFPFRFEGREQRFADRGQELKEQLYPMLQSGDEQPALATLMNDAAEFIDRHVLPKTEAEAEYLERFAAADYCPELLFSEPAIVEAARVNPEALWKLQNLEQMPCAE